MFLPGVVKAEGGDCSKYGCATCKYNINSYELTYILESDGSGAVYKKMEAKKNDTNSRVVYEITDNLSATNFISTSQNKLVCPEQIYVKFDGGASAKVGIKVFLENKKGRAEFELTSFDNNNKSVKNSEVNTISCDYNAALTVGQGSVKSTIVSDGKKILSQEYAGGYKPVEEDYSEIAKLFKDSNGELKCPSIYISCGANGNNKFCKIYEKNELSGNTTPGKESNDGDEPGKNDNQYLDSDINVKLNIQESCNIFSDAMKDWLIQLLDMIKIVGLVLAAILSMVDFLKGVGTGSADTMKKVWKSVGNRLIAVILLFLLPVLIEFIFGLVTIEGVDITNPLCGIK